MKKCATCGEENSENSWFCSKCGEALTEVSQNRSSQVHTETRKPSQPSPIKLQMQFNQKFGALRGIANLCNSIATIFLVIAGIAALVGLFIMFKEFVPGVMVILAAAIIGASYYIAFKLIAESIQVIIDIEMNTRQTASFNKAILEKLLNLNN